MNIGIIVIDTLRYDVFQSEMNETLRNADHTFERMYSTSRWTTPAHASLFTGYYPTEVGTHTDNLHLTTDQPTLAEDLAEEGYNTYLLSNNPHVDSFFSFDRGFNQLVRGPLLQARPESSTGYDWFELTAELSDGPLRYPEAVYRILKDDTPTISTLREGMEIMLSGQAQQTDSLDWVNQWIDEVSLQDEGNNFVFLNTMMCHSPYNPPEDFQSVDPDLRDPLDLQLGEDQVDEGVYEAQWKSYKDCARYVDQALQPIIEFIDWDALFIISDHGELFGEHELRQHQYGMFEELIHVPAVAMGSAIPTGTTQNIRSIVDIYETVKSLVNITSNQGHGIDLFSNTEREQVYAESTGSIKHSENMKGPEGTVPASWGKPHHAYITSGLDKVIDDNRGESVLNIRGDGLNQPKGELFRDRDDFRAHLENMSTQKLNRNLSEDLEQQLEDLGYK